MNTVRDSAPFVNGAGANRARLAAGFEPFDPIARLRARHDEITRHLRALDTEAPDAPLQWSNHLADHAQDHEHWESLTTLRTILSAELREVEHALRRADMGAYGRCEECGREIPPRRLQAVPAAVVCVACQERRESRRGVQ